MSKKPDEGDLNSLLMKEGKRIFPALDGFSKPRWARRIGIPGGEMDFVILNTAPQRLAVVECAKSLKGDLKQLLKYFRFVENNAPKVIAKRIWKSVVGSKKPKSSKKKTRQRANRTSPLRQWLKKRDVDALTAAISRSKAHPLTAILLVYLVMNPKGRLDWVGEMELPVPPRSWAKGHRWRLAVVAVR